MKTEDAIRAKEYFERRLQEGARRNTTAQTINFNLALEALEKQIPKKPIEKKVYMWEWTCPICNSCYVAKAGKTTIACENCGQIIRLE